MAEILLWTSVPVLRQARKSARGAWSHQEIAASRE
jgi:hypothetical protein